MKITLTSGAVRYTIEVEGLTFILRPQILADRVLAMEVLGEMEVDASNLRAGAVVLMDVMTVLCIESWEGVGLSDNPDEIAECSKENKLLLASQFPHIIAKIRNAYETQLVSAEKNSGSTPGGSEMPGEQESVGIAPSSPQSEKDEALDALNAS